MLTTLALASATVSGCSNPTEQRKQASLTFVQQWFAQAHAGERDEGLCHGLGLLKHAELSCQEMLDAAAQVDPDSRTIDTISEPECFGDVCGIFVEVRFSSVDRAGNELAEVALLKQDDGQLRMYWYRSDLLLAKLRAENPVEPESEKAPEQVAYDEITARYPSLYAYPPCYGIRASSSNLVGELMAKDAMDVAKVEAWAEACGETFCFSLVGNKIASLCPLGL